MNDHTIYPDEVMFEFTHTEQDGWVVRMYGGSSVYEYPVIVVERKISREQYDTMARRIVNSPRMTSFRSDGNVIRFYVLYDGASFGGCSNMPVYTQADDKPRAKFLKRRKV